MSENTLIIRAMPEFIEITFTLKFDMKATVMNISSSTTPMKTPNISPLPTTIPPMKVSSEKYLFYQQPPNHLHQPSHNSSVLFSLRLYTARIKYLCHTFDLLC